MTAQILRDDPGNAFVALVARARATSVPYLVIAECAGLFAALAIWTWIPSSWPLALVALAIGLLGLWGTVDHVMSDGKSTLSQPAWVTLRTFRSVVAVLGLVSAALCLWGTVGVLMGVFFL